MFRIKKLKTTLEVIEDQLKFWRGGVNNLSVRTDAVRRISEIENHLLAMHKEQTKNLIPERIKALEDAYAELMLMGREDK